MPDRQQQPADVSTPGHGQGEGPARYEFRGSGTKEIVGGAGANEVSVVLSGTTPATKNKRLFVKLYKKRPACLT